VAAKVTRRYGSAQQAAQAALRLFIASQPEYAARDLAWVAALIVKRSLDFQKKQRGKQAEIEARDKTEGDPWLLSHYSPEFVATSSLSRSATSSIGNLYGGLANDMARARYGTNPVLFGRSLDHLFASERAAHLVSIASKVRTAPGDTWVMTHVSEKRAHTLADDLIQKVKFVSSHQIGSPAFRWAFRAAVAELADGPQDAIWELKADIIVPGTAIGFCELKTGANLDSGKAYDTLKSLIKVALVYGDPEAKINIGVVGTRGHDVPSAIRSYFARGGESYDSRVFVGDAWWSQVLPESVTSSQFWEMVTIAGTQFNCSPKQRKRALAVAA
jgi:hypothetical protein